MLTKGSTIGNTLKQKVTADPVFSNDLLNNFYDQKTKLDQGYYDQTKQGVKNSKQSDDYRKLMNRSAKDISTIRKKMKQVLNDNSLTPKDQQAQLRTL